MDTVQQEIVAEQRLWHPLDAVTRDLMDVLTQKSRLLGSLERGRRDATHDVELHELLTAMYEQESQSIQILEPRLRRRLRACDPSSPREPW